jgi:hypothetical protein
VDFKIIKAIAIWWRKEAEFNFIGEVLFEFQATSQKYFWFYLTLSILGL